MRLTDLEKIENSTVILDIDGTLTHPGGSTIVPEIMEAVERLRTHNDVYLLSNRGDHVRDAAIAQILGVGYIETSHRKPDPRALRSLERKRAALVVIGDKILTDGLLALMTGARFIHISRIVSAHDSSADQLAHAIDDTVAHAFSLLRLLRPVQWAKNALVFVPLFFAREFFDAGALGSITAVFFAFCFIASAGYIINDMLDVEADRAHPRKRNRPLASGEVLMPEALTAAALLLMASAALFLAYAPAALLVGGVYFASSLVYSSYIKKIPLLEMVGFMWFYFARVLAGSVAVSIPLSAWLILAILFLSLFFIAAKRYAEKTSGRGRSVLVHYPEKFLEGLLFLSAGLVVVFYGLYSILGVSSPIAVYSTVPILAAVIRYLQLSFSGQGTEYPEKLLFSDSGIRIAGVAWFLLMLAVFY
ncbi:MAG TPA: UbiA family prenyltransferase [Candidatus Paceibacterota bacterium]|nr:UbiA family prenyltransferase [Candidatus Paceibacterota bacterium]